MKKIILPEFQEYLRSKSLVKEKYIPFYANWASKFLAFSKDDQNLSPDLQVQKFIDYLGSVYKLPFFIFVIPEACPRRRSGVCSQVSGTY